MRRSKTAEPAFKTHIFLHKFLPFQDIFSKSRVLLRCVDCSPVSIDLCPDCFAGKVEIGGHEAHHNYQTIDDGGFVILKGKSFSFNKLVLTVVLPDAERSWSAKEQLMLLDAIERHGYGNWEDIAKTLNTELGTHKLDPNFKTPTIVQDQFSAIFLHGSLGQQTWKEDLRGRARDHTEVLVNAKHVTPACLTSHESILLGYLPIRDDFEVEHENEAESMISHLQYNASQTPTPSNLMMPTVPQDEDELLEQELKAVHVEMYRTKLRDRERRKQVVRDHVLISKSVFIQFLSLSIQSRLVS